MGKSEKVVFTEGPVGGSVVGSRGNVWLADSLSQKNMVWVGAQGVSRSQSSGMPDAFIPRLKLLGLIGSSTCVCCMREVKRTKEYHVSEVTNKPHSQTLRQSVNHLIIFICYLKCPKNSLSVCSLSVKSQVRPPIHSLVGDFRFR